MKQLLVLIIILGVAGPLAAQQTVTRNVGPFKGVKAAEGIDVYLKKGTKESIKVEAIGTDPENVITEVAGSYLKIHMADMRGSRSRYDIKVYVEYVSLEKLSVSSAASIFSDGTIKTKTIELGASSAGEMKVSVEAEDVTISASSAGEIEVKGKCTNVTADASSAGEVDAYELESVSATAEASSAGSVQVNVSKNLNAQASTAGDVRYRGSPDKAITNSSSGGSVKKTN